METELVADFTVSFSVCRIKYIVNEESSCPDSESLEAERGMGSCNQHEDRRVEGEAKFSAVTGWNWHPLDKNFLLIYTAKRGP